MSKTDQDAIEFSSKSNAYHEFSNFSPQGIKIEGAYWPRRSNISSRPRNSPTCPNIRRRSEGLTLQRWPRRSGEPERSLLRDDWEDVKEAVMLEALRAQFQTHPALRRMLLETGERLLIEKAPSDSYWGCGRTGNGKNRLGVLLMQVLEELRIQDYQDLGTNPEETDQCGA